jgi:hypothetical protein
MTVIATYFAEQALRLANERTDAYRREAEFDRLVAAAPRRSRFSAMSAALASIRATLSSVDPDGGPVLPKLSDYPTRG